MFPFLARLLHQADLKSRKQHETGLKHIGNRERYIRDIYKEGNTAKREKEQEAAEIARIERVTPKNCDSQA